MGLTIDIYDKTWTRLGILFEVEYLSIKDSFVGIENSTLRVNKAVLKRNMNNYISTMTYGDGLKIGNFVIFNDTSRTGGNPANYGAKTGIVMEVVNELTNPYVEYTIRPLKSLLAQRLIKPRNAMRGADLQSNLIRGLVNDNAINDTISPSRNIPGLQSGLVVGDNSFSEINVQWESSWDNLADAIESICTQTDVYIGWNIEAQFNGTGNTYSNLKFYTRRPYIRTMTTGTSTFQPVIFSSQLGSFTNVLRHDSAKDYYNVAYGVGESKLGVSVGSTTTGIDRFEINLDSDKKTKTSQTNDLKSQLKQRGISQYYECELSKGSEVFNGYLSTWTLGDVVQLIVDSEFNSTSTKLDAQILMVEEVYEDESYELHVTFNDIGKRFNTLIDNKVRNSQYPNQKAKRGEVVWGGDTGGIQLNGTQTITIGEGYTPDETPNGLSFIWVNTSGDTGEFITRMDKNTKSNVWKAWSIPYQSGSTKGHAIKYAKIDESTNTIIGSSANGDTATNSDRLLLRRIEVSY